MIPRASITLLTVLLAQAHAVAQPSLIPSAKYRSVSTDLFSMTLQRNGFVDLHWGSDKPIFTNAFPMVWLEEDSEPDVMRPAARMSNRVDVNDPLGRGQGMNILAGPGQWSIRLYPSQPIMTAQYSYTNRRKKAVSIRAIYPWCTGDPRSGGFYIGRDPSRTVLLENSDNGRRRGPRRAWGSANSLDNLAFFDPETAEGAVAGFLTQHRTTTRIQALPTDGEDDEAYYGRFRAVCEFDPPVQLMPDATLVSEVFYISLDTGEPIQLLDRYFNAKQRIYAFEQRKELAPDRWDYWNTPVNDDLRRRPDPRAQCLYRGYPETTRPRNIHLLSPLRMVSWVTGAVFTGGLEDIRPCFGVLTEDEYFVLNKFQPPPAPRGRPVDIFDRNQPEVWSMPLPGHTGDAYAVALFNWDPVDEATVAFDFDRLGIEPGEFYAVFDYWNEEYFGAAQDRLAVEAPPNGVRLFVLRRYVDRPTLLGTNQHIDPNSVVESIDWDFDRGRLYGVVNATPGTSTVMYFLIPESYTVTQISLPLENFSFDRDGELLRVAFRAESREPIKFTLVAIKAS